MTVKLIVFDMAGTTVNDCINGLPLVTVAIQDAFRSVGYVVEPTLVTAFRGMEKKEAIEGILQSLEDGNDTSHSLVDTIFKQFKISLNEHLMLVEKEIERTSEIFKFLKTKHIRIAVGSGFPHAVVEFLVERLGWSGLVDYASSAEKEGHGRPHPALILSAMKMFNISDPKHVIKVGDTKVDIEEGKNAGCWTVGVLTGTQDKKALKESHPDFIVDSILDLPSILEQIGLKL